MNEEDRKKFSNLDIVNLALKIVEAKSDGKTSEHADKKVESITRPDTDGGGSDVCDHIKSFAGCVGIVILVFSLLAYVIAKESESGICSCLFCLSTF